MNVLSVRSTLRNVRRYGEIMRVLVRYGFADVLQELGLERLVERGLHLVWKSAPEFEHLPRAVRLRKAMEDLGTTFIKLGQVLSTRPDLIPEDWAEEFKSLQDDVPRLEFEKIQAVLTAEFGDELSTIFTNIDPEPVAAASIAQVHRATLSTGEKVVVKVLRPGVRETVESDMEILRAVAEFTEAHFANLGYSPTEVVSEFARELQKEVDLTHEARSTNRLRDIFADDPNVSFPEVYWEATTRDVLTIEEITGVLLSRLDKDAMPEKERKLVVANGARAVIRMCLEVGFFHADPHPGNIFALPGGKVCFIDCGMTGQLERRTTEHLADLIAGVVSGDTERVVRVLVALADVPTAKLFERGFRSDVRDFVGHFEHTPIDKLDMARLLNEFFTSLRKHHLRCPGDLVLLIKALTTIEAVARDLDPSFDMVAFARPSVEKLVTRRYSFSAFRRRMTGTLRDYAELLENLPVSLQRMLGGVQRKGVTVNLEHKGLSRLTHTIEHASRNISLALIIASLFVGSAILVLADKDRAGGTLSTVGIVGFTTAGMLFAVLLFSGLREGRRETKRERE